MGINIGSRDKETHGKQTGDKNASAGEKGKALELAIASIEKQFGKGSIMKLAEASEYSVSGIPTGALSLDLALGGRGAGEGGSPLWRSRGHFRRDNHS